MQTIDLHFRGPFAWLPTEDADFIFEAEIADNPGIYLWTVETPRGHLVWYVGQTRTSFRQRMKDHFKEQMSGSYEVYDPDLLAEGKREIIWPGYYGASETERIPEFLEMMPSLCDAMVRLAKITRFFVAPLEGDLRTHHRVEWGIGRYIWALPGAEGELLSRSLNYHAPWHEDEEHIELRMSCPSVVCGIPKRLVL